MKFFEEFKSLVLSVFLYSNTPAFDSKLIFPTLISNVPELITSLHHKTDEGICQSLIFQKYVTIFYSFRLGETENGNIMCL